MVLKKRKKVFHKQKKYNFSFKKLSKNQHHTRRFIQSYNSRKEQSFLKKYFFFTDWGSVNHRCYKCIVNRGFCLKHDVFFFWMNTQTRKNVRYKSWFLDNFKGKEKLLRLLQLNETVQSYKRFPVGRFIISLFLKYARVKPWINIIISVQVLIIICHNLSLKTLFAYPLMKSNFFIQIA